MNLPYNNDNIFVRRLTEIVLEHLDNEQFDVEELSKIAGISHSTLHRRLKSATKQSVCQFIQNIRLTKAMEMLQQGELTVSEIAWKTGFGSPAYFSSCFHEHFGISPSEVKKRKILEKETESSTEEQPVNIIPADVPRTGSSLTSLQVNKTLLYLSLSLLIVVMLAGGAYLVFNRVAKVKSLLVLPFNNLSENVQNQYFSDGIREDIMNNLYKISNLRIISRTTSDHFKGQNLTSREIAKQVDARYVLEGSVRQEGLKVRITVQLIDARNDQHLWSENYDRELTGFIGVQGEIAQQVAEKLNTVISEHDISLINKLPTQNPLAYDHYLRGRFLINKATGNQRTDLNKEGLRNSIKYFEMAIAADSSFVLAYAGLAEAWFTLSAWGWYRPYQEGLSNAKNMQKRRYCSIQIVRRPTS